MTRSSGIQWVLEASRTVSVSVLVIYLLANEHILVLWLLGKEQAPGWLFKPKIYMLSACYCQKGMLLRSPWSTFSAIHSSSSGDISSMGRSSVWQSVKSPWRGCNSRRSSCLVSSPGVLEGFPVYEGGSKECCNWWFISSKLYAK